MTYCRTSFKKKGEGLLSSHRVQSPYNRSVIFSSAALSASVIALAIVGAVYNYTPVPYKDMWWGGVDFMLLIRKGDWTVWFSQFNEHRIILTRILIFIDVALFNGGQIFLVVLNFIFIALSGLIFVASLRAALDKNTWADEMIVYSSMIIAWLFTWLQRENIEWGFQTQFFLAQLLPLAGLHFLSHCEDSGKDTLFFILACCIGALAAGAMANGLLALPLMLVYGIWAKISKTRIFVLAILFVTVAYLYLATYHSTSGTLYDVVKNPNRFVRYFFYFMGNQMYWLTGEFVVSKYLSFFSGLIFTFLYINGVLKTIATPSKNRKFLCVFILYVYSTAILCSIGRMRIGGVDQSLISRYTTPVLMAWCALAILYAESISSYFSLHKVNVGVVGSIFILLLLPAQTKALQQDQAIFGYNVGQVALTLGINDSDWFLKSGFLFEYPLNRVEQARVSHLAAFDFQPFASMQHDIGQLYHCRQESDVDFKLTSIVVLRENDAFLRVHGYAFNAATQSTAQVLTFVDSQDRIAGFALSGAKNDEAYHKWGSRARRAGFVGYVKALALNKPFTIRGCSPAAKF